MLDQLFAPLIVFVAYVVFGISGFGSTVSYSRKVFVPLTQLCRDVCHYCTFAKPPAKLTSPFLAPDAAMPADEDHECKRCQRSARCGPPLCRLDRRGRDIRPRSLSSRRYVERRKIRRVARPEWRRSSPPRTAPARAG